ncbi:MAG: glucose-6-phosphate isomerase [Nitrospirota bacterium]|nr:glucose-6-phosphate isomerase [Nitrospirota bacterium]
MSRFTRPDWISAQRVQLDSRLALADAVGPQHGVSAQELADLLPNLRSVHAELGRRRASGELGFYQLPGQDITPVLEAANWVRDGFDNFLLVGIGGSSLGPKAAHAALRSPLYNLLSREERGGPRLFLLENIDPVTVSAVLRHLDPARTCVNVVSKSGGTAETAANYLVAREWLEKSVQNPREHLIATTDPANGDLRPLAEREGWRTLPIPPDVGGRFSQLAAVGLLPAAVCGIDIAELLAGAHDMDLRCATPDLDTNPAYRLAALHYLADTRHGKPMAVMMPYADGLRSLADWFVQLWAESLGKERDLSGKIVHTGQTPLPALGASDQHSQVQLFVEGPNDKLITFLRVEHFAEAVQIPSLHGDVGSLAYLGGATLERLLNVEQAATEAVLRERQRPTLRLTVPELNPFAMGQLFFLFEVMTAFAGGLYGINAFDQPGVEHGKRLTYGAFGRAGYPDLMGGGGK